MTYNVLVIPEDAVNDQFILKPLLESLMTAVGKPRARTRILTDPATSGVDQVLDDTFLKQVVRVYPMVHLFVLCVDRDSKPGRDHSVAARSENVRESLRSNQDFVGCAAHQELEVWCLAGMADLPSAWSWSVIREELHPKEKYFEPYASGRGLAASPGGGREMLGREAASRYAKVGHRSPEVKQLEKGILSLFT